jgi:hypothetical protein
MKQRCRFPNSYMNRTQIFILDSYRLFIRNVLFREPLELAYRIQLWTKALFVWLGLEVAHCCGFHGFQTFGSCPGVSPTGRQAEVRNVQICINPTGQATQLIHSYLN